MTSIPPELAARAGRLALPAGLVALLLPIGTALAQDSNEALAASTPAKTAPLADLAHRYRFSERYARVDDDRAGPAMIGAYRVGIVEVVKDSIDTPKGAPRRSETARQAIFLERPAEVTPQGIPAATVRTFERFQVRPGDAPEATTPRPFEGLSIFCRPRSGDAPLLLSLVEGRKLRDSEYEVAARQAFLPHAAQILPTTAVRIGDTWRISKKAAQALIGEADTPLDALTGKLVELRREVDGPRVVAVISVTGRAEGPGIQTAINAEALFTGQPEAEAEAAPPAARIAPGRAKGAESIDLRGALTEIRLTRATAGVLPGPGRLRYRTAREVVIHRQLGISANTAAAIPSLAAPPAAGDANAWLSYVDPRGRFGFDHPQDLLPPDPFQLVAGGIVADPNTTTLTRARREGHDLFQVEYLDKIVGPEALRDKMSAKWGAARFEVMKGGEEWLPEAEWPKMKVHRIEAAIKAPERVSGPSAGTAPPRIHFDGYLIQFGQSATILAVATTSRDNVAAYRREVEQLLKTLQLNPSRPVEG